MRGDYPMPPMAHQQTFLEKFGLRKACMLAAEMGTGKAQPLSSKVLTPTGWREIGSLKVGEQIYAADGSITKVSAVHPQGTRKIYRVTMHDGASTLCCAEHLWRTSSGAERKKGTWSVKPLEALLQRTHDAAGNAIHRIQLSSEISFPEQAVPIDPYTLGVLLGDGCLIGAAKFTNSEPFIVEALRAKMPSSMKLSSMENNHNFVSAAGKNSYVAALKSLDLIGTKSSSKFIPDLYRFNTTETMLAVLQGLMDTDGTVDGNQAVFSTTSPALAQGVCDIARSLGGIARLGKKSKCGYKKDGVFKECQQGYFVTLNLPEGVAPFKLPRKASKYRANEKYKPNFRHIRKIEEVGEDECVCISIEHESSLYVTDDHIVTHNTYMTTLNIAELWHLGEIEGVLVLAPNGVHTNWILRELPKGMPAWCDNTARGYAAGMNKRERAHYEALYRTPRGVLRIAAFNWESLQNKSGQEEAVRFAESCGGRMMIVADESQNIKNPDASRTKHLMKELKPLSLYRRTLSGTPNTGSPFDVFAQYNFLSTTILGFSSFIAFKREFAELVKAKMDVFRSDGTKYQIDSPYMKAMKKKGINRMPPIVERDANTGLPKWRNLDKLAAMIRPHTFRVLKKDCLDLPEKVYKTAYFELTAEQRRHYLKAEEEARLIFGNDETPIAKLTVIGKLAQICTGYYLHPDQEEPVRIEGENPRMELLVSRVRAIIEDGHKVIVWARYHVQIADVVEACSELEGARVVQYHGKVKDKDRQAALDAFQEGDANIFVGQQQAGGAGITLTAATFMCYYSNDFSLTNRLQSEDRAHRIGQRNNVTYIDLIANNTVDDAIVNSLRNKQEVASIINGDNFVRDMGWK